MLSDLPIHDPDAEDIGMCDDCGTQDGRRFRTVIGGVWDGAPGRCVAWLCGPCKRARQATTSGGDGRPT